ncbi:hypothetical protein KEF29_10980 [Streptomyces tuirus]|uniref:Uncharacterized protein n=1 Tax=Streptomyces tuirus TaxID=68278 RepID=A0A941FGP5_9ACTN|nr:hypothetical protein [Streptomyces tuirus]
MSSEPRGRASSSAECLALDNDLVWAIRMISGALRRAAADASQTLPGGSRAYLVLVALAEAGDKPPRNSNWPARSVSTER